MDLTWLDDQALVQRGVFLLGFFVVGLWELAAPLQEAPVGRWRRWPANCLLYAGTVFVLILMGRMGAVVVAGEAANRGWGLSAVSWLPGAAATAIWMLASDLLSFVVHKLLHRVPWLWRLHRVHHSDTGFDLTTQFRFHPLEAVVTAGSQAALALLLAPPAGAIYAFELMRSANGFFGHANASFPARWERWLSLALVTPDVHRLHHSAEAADHDTNYGVFFSIWDRMAGTFRVRSGPLATGLEGVSAADSARPLHLLAMPFLRK